MSQEISKLKTEPAKGEEESEEGCKTVHNESIGRLSSCLEHEHFTEDTKQKEELGKEGP